MWLLGAFQGRHCRLFGSVEDATAPKYGCGVTAGRFADSVPDRKRITVSL